MNSAIVIKQEHPFDVLKRAVERIGRGDFRDMHDAMQVAQRALAEADRLSASQASVAEEIAHEPSEPKLTVREYRDPVAILNQAVFRD